MAKFLKRKNLGSSAAEQSRKAGSMLLADGPLSFARTKLTKPDSRVVPGGVLAEQSSLRLSFARSGGGGKGGPKEVF